MHEEARDIKSHFTCSRNDIKYKPMKLEHFQSPQSTSISKYQNVDSHTSVLYISINFIFHVQILQTTSNVGSSFDNLKDGWYSFTSVWYLRDNA